MSHAICDCGDFWLGYPLRLEAALPSHDATVAVRKIRVLFQRFGRAILTPLWCKLHNIFKNDDILGIQIAITIVETRTFRKYQHAH